MKQKTIITIACIVGLLLILIVPTCSSYNGMVTEEQSVDQKWAEVQTQYQRRLDLIPNLVSTVQGYAKHESTTLQNVTDARVGRPAAPAAPSDSAIINAYNAAENARGGDPEAYIQAQGQLKSQMDQYLKNASIYVNAVHEAYPDLKANENFARLQDELAGTENRINYARSEYTKSVMSYNVRIKRFPARIVASIFGFEPKPQFEAEAQAAKAPKVEF